MKMSPLLEMGMFQTGIAVVERNPAIGSLVELDFGSRKAEAPVLGRDLQTAAIPLPDIVVADDAFVPERTDALGIVGSGPPSFGGLARGACEATVVVGQEPAQDCVGRVDVASLGRAEFAGEAILQHAPEAFDAAFGLGRLRGDEGNAQLSQGAAELSGLGRVGEFFFDGPAVVVANEDAAAIPVESCGHTEAIEQGLEQAEVACGAFRRKELSGQDLAGGVVLHAQNGEARATALEPIEQEGFSLSRETLRRLLPSQGL